MKAGRFWPALALVCLASPVLQALEVSLQQVSEGPLKAGVEVVWVVDGDGSPLKYRFSVSYAGGPFAMVRDFNDNNQFQWAPMKDGAYTLRVTVQRTADGTTAEADAAFDVESRIGEEGRPVVSESLHPLVMLYSAPPCDAAGMSVVFGKEGSFEDPMMTHGLACDGASMNFWLGGLEPGATYWARYRLWNERGEPVYESEPVTFQSGTTDFSSGAMRSAARDAAGMDRRTPLLLRSKLVNPTPGLNLGADPVANKLDGTLVWYYDASVRGRVNNLLRPVGEGRMLLAGGGGLRIIDLPGNTVWETTAEDISARLVAMGRPAIANFHHDAIVLPNGNIVGLAASRRQIRVPGAAARTVIGDVLVLMDREGNVLWQWDAFDKLDVNMKAILNELNGAAEDWTHGNSIEYLADGNLLFSIRHLDWVVKIDFQDGAGSGDIIWKLGKGGDFQLDSSDPYPWFSHQHDAHFDGVRLWLYDNGNTRCDTTGVCGSRGQVYLLNEDARVAKLELSADVGVYSPALGAAQRLPNGDYQFFSGNLLDVEAQTLSSQSAEISPDAPEGIVRSIIEMDTPGYRAFRVASLYEIPR